MMNENSNHAPLMYQTEPVVEALNKVPNFNPLKYLRRTRDALKLDLPVQKLWFRMAHPNGPMRVTALRITDQMAIFEARVFLDRSDAEPISISTVQRTIQDGKDYIKAAQDDALSQALSDAGFGIQFSDAEAGAAALQAQAAAPHRETVQKAVSTPAEAVQAAGRETAPAEHLKPQRAPEPPKQAAAVPPKEETEGAAAADQLPVAHTASPAEETVAKAEETAAVKEEPAEETYDALPVGGVTAAQPGAGVSKVIPMPGTGQTEAALPKEQPTQQPDTPAETAAEPAYTPEMKVEDILKLMTYEEAQAVVVDSGVCKGKTIAQVAKERPVSLRFYLTPGNKSNNNIIRAAAQLVLDALQKAPAV